MKTKDQITDPVGARTYSPDEEVARKAPAVICAVASRTLRLRKKLEDTRNEGNQSFSLRYVEDLLCDYVAPLPFEKELLSGDIAQVDHAIRSLPQPMKGEG